MNKVLQTAILYAISTIVFFFAAFIYFHEAPFLAGMDFVIGWLDLATTIRYFVKYHKEKKENEVN